MNQRCYRLVFNPHRGMLVAVQESATGTVKGLPASTHGGKAIVAAGMARFAASSLMLGVCGAMGLPLVAGAQVVADPAAGANRPGVVQTANGLQQVNITRPSGAGVSMNAYSQFDVPRAGLILNNAATITQSRQAGYLNGNPNLLPGGSARIIVNQVTSTLPSQLRGYLEVAGPNSEVIVANPNGIVVDGAGFLNTSRATLTTGLPVFGGNGSLDAFRVTGGQITVQGAGLNASNVNQVDLIARAVSANAALHANQLNVIAGANQVDRTTLAATPISGSGAAPALGIDVSQLGGMYANKILLASTELGVGVSNRGVLAAQAGDLTLTAQGRLVLAGQTSASGKLAITVQDGIDHSGATYGAQAVSLTSSGALTNRGTLAAQKGLTVQAGSVASTGSLGAGVNADGTVGQAADLNVAASGALSATGRNVAGGNASLQGTSVNLAGGQTSADGNLALAASGGNLDLTGATTSAGAALNASAQGALVNDRGLLSSQGATTVTAGSVSNQDGQMLSQGTTAIRSTGTISNAQGIVQAAGAFAATAAALDNTAGRVVSLTGDGLSITTTGDLTNVAGMTAGGAQGGVIGANGKVALQSGALTNRGQISAAGDATLQAASLNNYAGSVSAGGVLSLTVAGATSNSQGTLSAAGINLSAAALDNSAGHIEADQLQIATTGDLVNRGGIFNQYGQSDTTIRAGGVLDNTSGTLVANGQDLGVSGQAIHNDGGKIQHAGSGALALASQSGLANSAGTIQTNGALTAQAASLDNTAGVLSARKTASVTTSGDLLNRQGALYGEDGLSVATGGQLDNTSGSAQTAGNLSAAVVGALSNASGTVSANGSHSLASVSAASLDNTQGRLVNAGDGATTVTAATSLINTGGTLGGNGTVTVNAQDLANTAGAQLAASAALTLNVTRGTDNRDGTLHGGQGLTLVQAGATLANDGGIVLGGQDVMLSLAALTNTGGAVRANRDIAVGATLSGSGEMIAGRNLALDVAGDYTNDAANHLRADGDMRVAASGTLTNTGTLAARGSLTAQGASVVNAVGGGIHATSTTVKAEGALANAGRIEGDTVLVQTATLTNTGTVIGNAVQVQATDASNIGAAAIIAAAQGLKVYATNSVSNLDGANLYSAGNLQIARDGARDASGMLANQVGTLTNSSATIEADGDIDIAAHTVNNVRTSIVTEAGKPLSTSQTLALWLAGLSGKDLYGYASNTFPSWTWRATAADISADQVNALRAPITVEVPKSTVTNLNAATQTFSFTQVPTDSSGRYSAPVCNDNGCTPADEPVVRPLTANTTQYYQGIQDTGATYRITFWPDWDPATNIRPDQVRVRYDLGVDYHDYNEISRTTATTIATDRLVSASAAASIQARGAIRINSDGGSILNQSSTMAAGGDLIRRATGGTVADVGTALQQSVGTTDTSTFYWHQKSGGSSDTRVVPYPTIPQAATTVMALPAIASSNQTVQTTAQDITVATVNRVGQTVTASGVTGGNASGSQVGGLNGRTSRPQTLGTAGDGIPTLSLPINGLFHFRTAPRAAYLVATDPRFTQYGAFISSDYMLGQLGLNPQTTQKRLGDGFYEEKLVRDQVTQLTGRTFLAGHPDQLGEYVALMTNGVSYAKAFQLTPGIGLSDAQMAQLTTDMVWLVSQDVALPDGTHQSVLVPKLYLAQANAVDLNSAGALVMGHAVSLSASGNVAASGNIVGDVATQVLGNNIANRGQIGGAGGITVVQARQDVRNLGGRIAGQDVLVAAGRDMINETQTISEVRTLGPNGYSAGATGVGAVAAISAANNVAVLAGRDLTFAGGTVDAGNNALLAASRDLNVTTVALGTTQDAVSRGGQSYSHDQVVTNQGSRVLAGQSLTAVAGRDVTLANAGVRSGVDTTLVAGRNLTVTAAKDTHRHNEGALGGKGAEYTQRAYDESVKGSVLQAGGNATLGAGQGQLAGTLLQVNGITPLATSTGQSTGDLAVLGSSLTTDKGAAELVAAGDVTVGAVQEHHSAGYWGQSQRSGFLASERTTVRTSSQSSNAVGSTVSGDSLSTSAGRDLTVLGSTVAATNDVSLQAGRNLTLGTTQDSSRSSTFQQTTKSGLGATGSGLSYGNRDQKATRNDSSVARTGSLVGSTDGNVQMTAGSTLTVSGSQIIAARDVSGVGADIVIEAAQSTQHRDETHEVKQSGFTLGVSGGAIGAALNAAQKVSNASESKDGRAAALWSIAAARDTFDAGKALVQGGGNPAAGATVTLSWGSSHSKQTFTQDATAHTGSGVTAGGSATFVATGIDASGNKTAGDLNLVGSDIGARQIGLAARHDVNIVSATDTDESHSTNRSSSSSVGVSYGAQGFGFSASASRAKGNSDSVGATPINSHVTGSELVNIVSGNDANVRGGIVGGGKVAADAGGNLNIASRQDTEEMQARRKSMGGGFSVSQGGGSASVSASQQKANGSYANVREQAGIRAGEGGFDISVKGNTDLKGAVIASSASADKNSLTTGTLSWSDLQNRSDYSASSSGVSAGGTFGSSNDKSNSGPTSGRNTGGISPMIGQSASGSQNGIAQSAISEGNVTIKDAGNQKQDLASLNRDAASTNATVGKNPDLNAILGKQADMMAAAQAAGEAVAKSVGDIADKKQAVALANAKQANDAGDLALAQQYKDEAAQWAEGGGYRAGLQSAGGALIAGLGGGNALAGAASAGLASLAAPALEDVGNAVAGSIDTGNANLNEALGNLAANMAAGGLGAVVGGSSGAATAANVDRFNRQLHPDEIAKILSQENGNKAGDDRLIKAACYVVQCWAEYPVGSADYNKNYVSSMEAGSLTVEIEWVNLQKQAGLFSYSLAQRAGDAVKSDPIGVAKDGLKAVTGAVTALAGGTICGTNLAGCIAGGPMAALGASDAVEGITGLTNAMLGYGGGGFNPVKNGLNGLMPIWGSTVYDGAGLAFGLVSMGMQVPLRVGIADGLNRPNSIFGVTVSKFNNPKLVPVTNVPFPNGTAQNIMIIGVGGKAFGVVSDISNAGNEK